MHFKSIKNNLRVITALSLLITSLEFAYAGKNKRVRDFENNGDSILRTPILDEVQAQPPVQKALTVEKVAENQERVSFPLLALRDELILLIMQYKGVAKDMGNVCRRTERLRTHPNVPLCTVFKARESLTEYFTVRRWYPKQHIKYSLLPPTYAEHPRDPAQTDFYASDNDFLVVLLRNLRQYEYPIRSLTFKFTPALFKEPELLMLDESRIPGIYFSQMDYSHIQMFTTPGLRLRGIKQLAVNVSDLISLNPMGWEQLPLSTIVGLTVDSCTDEHVRALRFPRKMRELSFIDCQLSDLGFALFLPNLSLRKLSIEPTENTRFTEETTKVIATSLPRLEVLDMRGITEDGVRHLSTMTNLRQLRLNECGLGDHCAPDIGKMIRLTKLDLSTNNFTNACFKDFLGLRSLERIELRENPVSLQGLYQFRGMLELFQTVNKKRVREI